MIVVVMVCLLVACWWVGEQLAKADMLIRHEENMNRRAKMWAPQRRKKDGKQDAA